MSAEAPREDKWQIDGRYHIPYIGLLIAKRIGATGYRQIPPGTSVPWSKEYMGGQGYVIGTDRGRVFLDADIEKGKIWLTQISVERRGLGLGTDVMNAIRDIAAEKDLSVVIFKVTNPEFFGRFDWLATDDGSSFVHDQAANTPSPGPR